jgi:hypothetical protein
VKLLVGIGVGSVLTIAGAVAFTWHELRRTSW